ncbi:EamA family transporter RarD [soil metagenome]
MSALPTEGSIPTRSPWEGAVYAILAYTAWGIFPIYWKFFGQAPTLEIISHRIVWSLLFLIVLAWWRKDGAELRSVLHSPKRLTVLFATVSLLSANWGLFIYGVNSNQVVESSMGYFINPLFNVLLGFLFLRERLTRPQVIACGLAGCGVLWFGWHLGKIPWIALGLATTFGLYGLLRKVVAVTPIVGLLVETALMTPIAGVMIWWLSAHHDAQFASSPHLTLLFIGAGIVTSLPLIWFNNAAKLLPLSTLGFFQYLAPSLQLLLGVALYREPFTMREAFSFLLIWSAIAIYLRSSFAPRAATPLAD